MSEREYLFQKKEFVQSVLNAGVECFPYAFPATHTIEELVAFYKNEPPEKFPNHVVRCAGRIISTRWHGKTCFMHIQGRLGKIQLYGRKNDLGATQYNLFISLDVGDVIGVEGKLFRTRTGELTIHVQRWVLLAKCFMPMPERWHGLVDKEIRFRRRYLDAIVNQDVRKILITRARILKSIRHFLDGLGFIEVETPMMQPVYGGALARPFITHHNTLDMDLYLRIAPELYLKRLIVGDLERVYELNRCFRNEGISPMHNPEFTSLELYQAYADYHDIMKLTEELIANLCIEIHGTTVIQYGEYTIDLTPPWRRISLVSSLLEKGILTEKELEDETRFRKKAHEMNLTGADALPIGKLLTDMFEKYIEHELIEPAFVIDYPIETSPLARNHRKKEGFVERFELFIGGLELANAFSELMSPFEQYRRFLQQQKLRVLGDQEAHEMDEDYVLALLYGLPPTGGLGIGIDRLTMLLTNTHSIREVIAFPLLRYQKTDLPFSESDIDGNLGSI